MTAIKPATTERTKRLLFMYGTAPQGELNAMLEKNSVDPIDLKAELRQGWKGAARHYHELVKREAGAPDAIRTSKLPPSVADVAEDVVRSPAFKTTFAAYSVTIEEVELDLLIAPQRTVDLDFAATIAGGGGPVERARMLLDPCRRPAPLTVVPAGDAGYAFASNHPGALLAGAIERPYEPTDGMQLIGGRLAHAVTLLIGFPADTANAYRVGKRIILNNGFHRVFALRQAGVMRAPLAILDISFPELEMPPTVAEFPSRYLVEAVRPAMIKDFFDPAMVCEVNVRARTKILEIAWSCRTSYAPWDEIGGRRINGK